MAKVYTIFYSMYGHLYMLAERVHAGAATVSGVEASLFRVPELLPQAMLEAAGAATAQQAFAHVPLIEPARLVDADAIIVGTPTRFGNMAFQMRGLWDATAELWFGGKLFGKLGSAFTSTGTQHGGHETTIVSIWHTFAHHGMIIVPPGYVDRRVMTMEEISGGGPYGASTMSDVDGSRLPTENELGIAESQGRYVAQVALKMFG